MPRRPRIEMPGCHHVLNRGVEQRRVFLDDEDFQRFLEFLCESCFLHDVTLHDYCLMSNHYHLLLETKRENLSQMMRLLNSRYAAYFNRKNKRNGHLWQGRFKSWYVTDTAYMYTLIRYIEHNPVAAKMVTHPKAYAYSASRAFLEEAKPLPCMKEALLFEMFHSKEERERFLLEPYDKSLLKEIQKDSKLVVASHSNAAPKAEKLIALFEEVQEKHQRNSAIQKAVQMGFSQHQIASVFQISQSMVSYIMKRAD